MKKIEQRPDTEGGTREVLSAEIRKIKRSIWLVLLLFVNIVILVVNILLFSGYWQLRSDKPVINNPPTPQDKKTPEENDVFKEPTR